MDKPTQNVAPEIGRRRQAEAAEWFVKLRATEPTAKDISAWLDWHGRDSRNAKAFERARAFAGRIHATDSSALAGLVAEFSQPAQGKWSRWQGWGMRIGAAATALTAVMMAYWTLAVRPIGPTRLKYQTDVATNRDIALPDGSSIVLGAESKLNASFTPSARRIDLQTGEAYFKVKHDFRRPFYVHAGKLDIRDVGTAFDVRKTGQRVRVTVTRGQVQVTEAGADATNIAATNSVEVGAGQQVLYTPGAPGLHVTAVDPSTVLGWQEQRLQFVNAPLTSVVDNINRYARRPLRIGDPAIGRLSFTGTVDLYNLGHWLTALPTIFPVQVEHLSDSDVISPIPGASHR